MLQYVMFHCFTHSIHSWSDISSPPLPSLFVAFICVWPHKVIRILHYRQKSLFSLKYCIFTLTLHVKMLEDCVWLNLYGCSRCVYTLITPSSNLRVSNCGPWGWQSCFFSNLLCTYSCWLNTPVPGNQQYVGKAGKQAGLFDTPDLINFQTRR